MTAPPKRRWFRFGLRTLFVVVTMAACVSGYVMWQRRMVQERKAIINDLFIAIRTKNGGAHMVSGRERLMRSNYQLDPGGASEDLTYLELPWIQTHFGAESMYSIKLSRSIDLPLIERIERAYPESILELEDVHGQEPAFRDALCKSADKRKPNKGHIFKTGLIEK